MRHKTMLLSAVFCVCIAACGGSQDGQAEQTDAAMKASGVPSAETVAAAQAAGNRDTGGRLSADISGVKAAHTEITDIGYCVMKSYGMEIFALSGNNAVWSVSIAGMSGLPAVGDHRLTTVGDPEGYSASVTDKSTGSEPAAWQRYESTGGTVTFSKVTPTSVEGTFKFEAMPQGPQTTGPALNLTGTFASPVAEAC